MTIMITVLLVIALPTCITCGVLAIRESGRNHHRQKETDHA